MKVLALCALTLFAGAGAGYTFQDKAQDKQDKKPAGAADMAMEQPGPEHALIAKLAGEWTATMKMNGAESKGSMSRRMQEGGFNAIEEFKGDMSGMQFVGHGVTGYDLQKKQYWGFWCDGMSSSPSLSWGSYDAKTKQLTMTGEMMGPDGKMAKTTMITHITDDDHHEFVMKMPAGSEGKVMEVVAISYARAKK